MEKFAIGILLGGVAGALLCANNQKMRSLVKKSQEELQTKFDEMLDEKLRNMESSSASGGASEDTATETKKSAK